MKKKIFLIPLILMVLLTACGQQKNYNYNRLNVKTIINNEYINEDFNEEYSTVYFKSKENTKSYEYIIKEEDKEEYSLDSASTYLLSMKDILKQSYQMSKKETKTTKKSKGQFICTYEYSAIDNDNTIYTVKTKYIYDTKTKEAVMVIAFIDDSDKKEIKESLNQIFDETVLKTDEELK